MTRLKLPPRAAELSPNAGTPFGVSARDQEGLLDPPGPRGTSEHQRGLPGGSPQAGGAHRMRGLRL